MNHWNSEIDHMNPTQKWCELCPACGSITARSIKYRFKHGHWVYKCTSCKLRYVNPQPSDASIFQLYNSDYFQAGGFDSYGYKNYKKLLKLKRFTFTRWLCELEASAQKGRLLEIGCASGVFLEIAEKRGWEVTGVDVSRDAAEEGRRKGLNIYDGTLRENLSHLRDYDVVLMLDAFEHMRNPLECLESVYKVLRPGGIVYIITPNAGSASARILGVEWPHLKPKEHLCLFTKRSMRIIIERTGFELIKISISRKIITFDHLIEELPNSMAIKFLAFSCKVLPFLRGRKFYLPLGEMRVAAKKSSNRT